MKDERKRTPRRSALLLAAAILAPAAADAACNTAPTAVADVARAYDQAIVIDVLANDVDAEGQALTVAVTSETCPGLASVVFDLVTYTPSTPLVQGQAMVRCQVVTWAPSCQRWVASERRAYSREGTFKDNIEKIRQGRL